MMRSRLQCQASSYQWKAAERTVSTHPVLTGLKIVSYISGIKKKISSQSVSSASFCFIALIAFLLDLSYLLYLPDLFCLILFLLLALFAFLFYSFTYLPYFARLALFALLAFSCFICSICSIWFISISLKCVENKKTNRKSIRKFWYPRGESNPRFRRERATS